MGLPKTIKTASVYKKRQQKICIATGIHCHKQYFSFPYKKKLYGCFYNLPIMLAWCKDHLSVSEYNDVDRFYPGFDDIPVIDYKAIRDIKKIPAKKKELLRQFNNNMLTYARWDYYVHPKGSTRYGVFKNKNLTNII